ncbi:MAG: hypothetical protein LBP22_17250 [Deltaproteobacteria bacterium]|nr:hypothetical protein [Deltaproteobacteria bacterium]
MNSQRQIPRSVEIIKEQLAELADVTASVNIEAPVDFATKITLDSLSLHKEDLLEELKAAELLSSQ